jgi:hypothetical protein
MLLLGLLYRSIKEEEECPMREETEERKETKCWEKTFYESGEEEKGHRRWLLFSHFDFSTPSHRLNRLRANKRTVVRASTFHLVV